MVFGMINNGIGLLLPIICTYRAFEKYTSHSNRIAASNVNIAGFNVPINSLFKKATGEQAEPIDYEERLLQYELITLQKWIVYWLVFGSAQLVETVFFLYYLPGYSLIRLGFSIWLMVPILTSKFQKIEVNSIDIESQWLKFTNDGCGLIYFSYLRPLLDSWLGEEDNTPADFDKLKQVIQTNAGTLMYYLSLLLNLAQKDSTDANTPAASKFSNVFNSVKSYVPSLQAPATQEAKPVPESNVEDEYDVIDKPNDDSKKSSASTSGAEVKRGWLW